MTEQYLRVLDTRPLTDLVYLASPYSHPDAAVRQQRFEEACRAAGSLMARGVKVFSPIAHTHPIAESVALPKGWDYWRDYDRAFLNVCMSMIVLCLPGWEESVGIAEEMRIMQAQGKPVSFMSVAGVTP